MITVRQLQAQDADLAEVAEQLNSPEWEGSIGGFSASSLTRFLQDDSHIYLVAYLDDKLAGAAHAYVLKHPTDAIYLYIDEVDTRKPYRRQGVATAMMQKLLELAADLGASEAWVGADEGNEAAYGLYRKLGPNEEEPGTIFTYKVKDGSK